MFTFRLFLDSGAPTLYNKLARGNHETKALMGAIIKNRKHDQFDWVRSKEFLDYREKYIEYIHANKDHLEVYANLDIINNVELTWENQRYLESCGLKPLPVWHFGCEEKWLWRYLDKGYDYIGIGGVNPNPRSTWEPGLDRTFANILCDKDGYPKVKLHGFATTGTRQITRYPWYCMSYRHKVLTKNGWKGGNEVEVGELVLCHTQQGKSIWSPVKQIFKHTDTPIVYIDQLGFQAETTPNHRWLLYNSKTNKRKFVETRQLRDYRSYVIERFGQYQFPQQVTYSNDYVELAAWFFTEGSIRYRIPRYRNNSIALYQSEKTNPQYCEQIRELILRMGEAHYESKPSKRDQGVQWELYGDQSKKLLMQFPDKVPSWSFLYALTEEQCKIFIDTCIKGDGYNTTSVGKDTVGITQSEKTRKLVRILQVALFLMGRTANISYTNDGLCLKECSVPHIATGNFGTEEQPLIEKSEIINGDTWCIKVETGAFYTQCNGLIYVTGNSTDSATWIKMAAMGNVRIPQRIKGQWQYLAAPHAIAVTPRNPARKIPDGHIDTLRPNLRSLFMQYIEEKGFVLGESKVDWSGAKPVETVISPGLVNNPVDRCFVNALYFMELTNALPKWPWPFKAHNKERISLF